MTARILIALVLLAALVVAARAALRLSSGFSARTTPTAAERVIARAVRRSATPRDAANMKNPIAFSPQVWADARAHFADHCANCHGNDGGGQTEIGQNLYPKAPDMRLPDTQELSDGELYWIIENGVRLTGMPAWGDGTAHDADTWKLVHFVRHLKELTPDQLEEMQALNPRSPAELKEDEDDRRFLAGEADAPPPPPAHHHGSEAP